MAAERRADIVIGGACDHSFLGPLLGFAQGMECGALPMLLARLENAGLSERVQSWLGHGESLPVTAEELGTVFTLGRLNAWAEHAGTTPDAVRRSLLQHCRMQWIGRLPAQRLRPCGPSARMRRRTA